MKLNEDSEFALHMFVIIIIQTSFKLFIKIYEWKGNNNIASDVGCDGPLI